MEGEAEKLWPQQENQDVGVLQKDAWTTLALARQGLALFCRRGSASLPGVS